MKAVQSKPNCLPLTLHNRKGAMKRSKFATQEGLVMLLGVILICIVLLWLILSGIVQIND
jgi:hypothetical protein